ncbi:uncharacterized protein VP01_204g6 [Puccinia sorghi]|uniref:Integrase catalytic domain-containing protein n=1 Tax=Puccinia sorghi TaxID=27349 RepID=A0A0L6VAT0_9BASI|nr:uncharacterized protein VP01_204g6 [Puccinia sorghi]
MGSTFADNNPDNVRTIFSQSDTKVSLNSMMLHSKTLELRDAQLSDARCRELRNNITSNPKDYSISSTGLLLYKQKIMVPDDPKLKLSIFESRHDSPSAGHFGQEKTYRLISRDFYWPGMTKDVKDYVNRCYDCNRNKSSNHRKFGLLQPLPIPPLPWHSLSMDFISQLPLSNDYDAILVVVDRFSKMSLFIRTKTTCTSSDLAELFVEHVFSKHGLPDNIVSDRGSLFVSSFWTSLYIPSSTQSTCHLQPLLKIISPTLSNFKSNFELTSEQPVNAIKIKQTNFESNHRLLISAMKARQRSRSLGVGSKSYSRFEVTQRQTTISRRVDWLSVRRRSNFLGTR